MEQVKSFCRRYRRLLLAAAYRAIFAVGVLYLRVTVNIPPEGVDKLTLNRWLYDFQRMPFWQYALQDLQGRLRYFTLQEVRFFPFHYPNAARQQRAFRWLRRGARGATAPGRIARVRGEEPARAP